MAVKAAVGGDAAAPEMDGIARHDHSAEVGRPRGAALRDQPEEPCTQSCGDVGHRFSRTPGLVAAGRLLVFVLLGSIAIIVPVIVYFAGGERAAAVLAGWKEFLVANNPVIMAILLLVFGMVLIGKGIAQL